MSNSESITVVLADDHSFVRQGIRHVLDDAGGFTVLGEASRGDEVPGLMEQLEPDVLVLDISMPGATGIELTGEVRAKFPTTRVLILSMHDDPEYVLEAVRAGANGYLLKDAAAEDLPQAIQAVHRGEAYYSPPVQARLTEAVKGELRAEERRGNLNSLTGREVDVLQGIARGLTNKEIASELGISHRTVETHRESLMRKLRIRHVAGLTKFALESGIVDG